jgi:hypothetical protein
VKIRGTYGLTNGLGTDLTENENVPFPRRKKKMMTKAFDRGGWYRFVLSVADSNNVVSHTSKGKYRYKYRLSSFHSFGSNNDDDDDNMLCPSDVSVAFGGTTTLAAFLIRYNILSLRRLL